MARPPLETIFPALSITTPAPLVLSFRLTALPLLVMLPGAEIVNVSLPPRVCAAVVAVSICTVLPGLPLPGDQQGNGEDRRWGEKGMGRTALLL